MIPLSRAFSVILAATLFQAFVFAQDEAAKPRIGEDPLVEKKEEKKEVSVDEVKIARTTVFDEAEIKKLYKDYKTKNDKLIEDLPAHINGEELDLVTLKPLSVDGVNVELQRDLVEFLDPKPRRRLQRIMDIDPDAAHEMMVTMRNDQEFMSGTYDPGRTAGDPGRPGFFDSKQLSAAFEKATAAVQKAMGKKKAASGSTDTK